ncbi:MAG: hypothetical protein J1E35_05900 [Lachnospiraceae bacterium]|nr:hypothetical protein [Lachnospiraceae bacterium]
MKNKCKIIWLLFTASLLFTGCNRGQNLPDSEFPKQDNQRQEGVVTPGGDEILQKNEVYNSGEVSTEHIWLDINKVNQLLEELNAKEKFLEVMLLKEDTLLLRCQNRESEECVFYVLCLKEEGKNIRPIELNLVGRVDCYTYEDCIVLYDTMNHVIVLDHQFGVLNEILIPDFIHSAQVYPEKRNYCILPRNQKVLYYMTVLENKELYVGLYETDYACNESRLVYRLEGPETNLNFLNGFYKIRPGYSQKGIFFTGDYFETIDSQSKKCVGYLDLDSGVPVVCKTNMQYMELTSAGIVFFDGYRESDREYSGELLTIDESGNVSRIATTHFKESERVSCDRQDRMLTCYETESGETVLNLYKENIWEKQVIIPYSVEDFILLNQGQCILCSYRSQDGFRILLQEI